METVLPLSDISKAISIGTVVRFCVHWEFEKAFKVISQTAVFFEDSRKFCFTIRRR